MYENLSREELTRQLQNTQTELNQTKKALEKSEARFNEALDNAQHIMYCLDMKTGKYVYSSKYVNEITGWEVDEFQAEGFMSDPFFNVHPNDKPLVLKIVGEAIECAKFEGKAPFHMVYRRIYNNNETGWLNDFGTLYVDKEGNLERVVGSAYIVTEQKEAEIALKDARDELELRVKERTSELENSNKLLTYEIKERKKAEAQVHALNKQLLKVQEDERHRLSRDLHDEVAQDLSTLKIGWEAFIDNTEIANSGTEKDTLKMSQLLQRSIQAVRDMACELRPPGLDEFGLVKTCKLHCEDFSFIHSVKIDFLSAGLDDLKLDYDLQINLFRLLQEALNNVRKHAGAKKVNVKLVASHPSIILRVDDDGCGFDVKERLKSSKAEKRIGLQSMAERVRLLDGDLEIRSNPQKGTKIMIEIPVEEMEKTE